MPNSPIASFDGEYDFLTNFFEAQIVLGEKVYATNEHAFQATKCLYPEEHEQVRLALTPGLAKRIGRRITMRPDWDIIKNGVMLSINLIKYVSHPQLRQKLLATGQRVLIEGNWWGDTYWGVCKGVGENHLGKTLMHVRYILSGFPPQLSQ